MLRELTCEELGHVSGGTGGVNVNATIDLNRAADQLGAVINSNIVEENELNKFVSDFIDENNLVLRDAGTNQHNGIKIYQIGNSFVGDRDGDGKFDFVADIEAGHWRYVTPGGEIFWGTSGNNDPRLMWLNILPWNDTSGGLGTGYNNYGGGN